MPKTKDGVKFRKAPGAPRRFKSSYMFFSSEKHKEIRDQLEKEGRKEKTTAIAKQISAIWKEMTPEQKRPWEDKAREDKSRYEIEKNMYNGPWKIPAKRRARKDRNAPRRPMSAFLDFAKDKRAKVRAGNPNMNNIDVSRELAKMWKEAPQEERQAHVEKEAKLRAGYKVAIAEWRAKNQMEESALREHRESAAVLQLRAMPVQYENESSYSPDKPVQNPFVAPAYVNTLAAAHMYSNASSGYPHATGFYGYPSSTYPSFGTNSNNTWMQGPSVDTAAVYPQEQEHFAHTGSHVYGNPYSGAYPATTGPARSFSGGHEDEPATRDVNTSAYGTSQPYTNAMNLSYSFSQNNQGRGTYDREHVGTADWSSYPQWQSHGGYSPQSHG